jgi:Short C-terminal domain
VSGLIRYWLVSLLGMLVCLASILVMSWAIYHLVRTGTCASGGPYVSARQCPSDTGAKIVGLMGSIFALLIGGAIYAARGNRGHGAGSVGMGVVLWALLFICLAVSTFVAAYGPANNDAPGAKTAAIVLMVVFLPMGILPLLGAVGFGVGRKRFSGGESKPHQYPTPAPPQYSIPVPSSPGAPIRPPTVAADAPAGQTGDVAARLRKLDELRDSGLLTDDEFEAKKADLLKEL